MPLHDPDVTFLHPPAIYDFRDRPEFLGPISDVIPSTPVFEMYPIGLTSIADHLEEHGYDVQLVNLAYLMLGDEGFDPEVEIADSPARVFAIDLHWLPHAQGAIEVARLVKRYHPDAPVVFGGRSSGYYHEELIEYDCVDYVLRGDSTREPMRQLVEAVDAGADPDRLADIPNLTWQRDGEAVINPLTNVVTDLDAVSVPSYSYVIRSVMKYGSISKVMPYRGWFEEPMTMLLTARGCTYNCSFCGGSRSAYADICNRDSPAFRSPERLQADVESITAFSEGPIFIVHDIRMGGRAYVDRFLELLAETDVDNEFVFELFRPAEESYFERWDRAVEGYSLELSIESHDPEIRKQVGKFGVPNEDVERTLAAAFENGCETIDLFFMIGLPGQTADSVLETVEYCDHLLERFESQDLKPFIAPLAPFVDPGSPAFENPEEYGYELLAESFEDHRQKMLEPGWKGKLNYETEWLDRDELVEVTYEAARRLNEIKHDQGVVDDETYERIDRRLDVSATVTEEIDRLDGYDREERLDRLAVLNRQLDAFGEYSIAGEDELSWENKGLRDALSLARFSLKVFVQDVSRQYAPSWLQRGRP